MSKMTRESHWAEISNEYAEAERPDFINVYIDAWTTGDENEEGEVLANVIGASLVSGATIVEKIIRDPRAYNDPYFQEVLKETEEYVINHLVENIASRKG